MSFPNLGAEAGEQAMAKQVEWGFAYVPEICERLKQCEKERDRFAIINEFFPQIVDLTSTLKLQTDEH